MNFFWQREKGMKKMNSTSFVFKVWKTIKLKKVFAKEEEEEIQENVQRDSKDVPSNVLSQSSQAVSPLKLCEWGNKRILRRLVL